MKKISYITTVALLALSALTFSPSTVKASSDDKKETSYGTSTSSSYGQSQSTGTTTTTTDDSKTKTNNGNSGNGNNGNGNGNNGNGNGNGGDVKMPINNGIVYLLMAGTLGGIVVLRKKAVLAKA